MSSDKDTEGEPTSRPKLEDSLETETCFNCGENVPYVVYDVDHHRLPVAVIWFDEGHPGSRYEPPEPATLYVECFKCFSERFIVVPRLSKIHHCLTPSEVARAIGELEDELRRGIKRLPRYGKECMCFEKQVHEFVEEEGIARICLNCGGYVQ
ncbi:hypothetical protein [Archaeoglobus neptunius]|uniref:hypothetical protein n=1 Tax=Archaeoglobus neptunius TaxID=2798580 RepID=UPI001927429C|nr:hypothetical protein [Archaeoglobus neptunius]